MGHVIIGIQSFVGELVALLPLAHGAADAVGRGRTAMQTISNLFQVETNKGDLLWAAR